MPQRGRTQRGRQERPPPQPQGTRGGCWAGTSARASGAGAGPGCAAPSRNSAASSGPRRGRAGREAEESGKVTRARGGAGVAWQRGRHGRRGGDPTAGGLAAEPEAGHRLLVRTMVPQSPSQVRGGPENTHQGGASGWEKLQMVCVWPKQETALL
ncbi:Rho Gtpase-Activating Protein Syde2 [Manis pentadactyla]|nr:Rho Gtpase-Activating Protein Syde2 [Manis pentadactyla]